MLTPTALLIAVVTGVSMVTGQHTSVCSTEYYRDLSIKLQNEHQCLLLEQFNEEFFAAKEDKVRRAAALDVALQDINYKLDQILMDLDPEYWSPNPKRGPGSNHDNDKADCEEQTSDFKPSVDLQPLPKDCAELLSRGVNTSGVYPIRLYSGDVVLATCDMDTDGGGWTVVQRRTGPAVLFNRTWEAYKHGFGLPSSDHWLGLDALHDLSSNQNTSLRIDLWDWEELAVYAEYSVFYVAGETDDYSLVVSGYQGDAGDSLSYHGECSFSTPDRDNDRWAGHCAKETGAGWWYRGCSYADLNGRWYPRAEALMGNPLDGILWYHWKESYEYPLPRVEMKIRPRH